MHKYKFPIIAAFVFLLVALLPYTISAQAAAKPKAKETKVTLYTDSEKYTIELSNVADDAKIKYSSSKKSVATVKKGVVTPKKAGKTTVTVKVTQNNKTYKIKIKITVKEPEVAESEETKPDYDALAAEKVQSLNTSLTKNLNTILRFDESEISRTAEDVKANIINNCKTASLFHLYFEDLDGLNLIRSEEEYLTMMPSLKLFKIYDATQFKNIVCVTVSSSEERDLYADEFAIDSALSIKDSSYLESEELALYNQVITLAKKLKGKTEYDTVKNIHDYLVLNIAYPSSYSGRGVHTLDYALNEGVCVCDGYTKAFYFLCKANGIDCIIVKGLSINQAGVNESHAWNKVKVDGKWYTVDATWDDPLPDKKDRVKYYYFLVTDADASKTHTWDDTGLPKAESSDLGIVYTEYADVPSLTGKDKALEYLKQELAKCASEKTASIEIRFFETSMDKNTYAALQTVFSDFCKKNYYGGSIGYESVGFLGYLYTVTLSK